MRRRQFPDRRQEISGFHPEGYLRAPIVRERDLRLESLRVRVRADRKQGVVDLKKIKIKFGHKKSPENHKIRNEPAREKRSAHSSEGTDKNRISDDGRGWMRKFAGQNRAFSPLLLP